MTSTLPHGRLACALLAAALLAGCGWLQTRPSDDLKVSRAVLYQNGIGYFERQGKVKGQQIKLPIMPHQITDVLKSITLESTK